MSSVKCVAAVAVLGGVASGAVSLHYGLKARKLSLENAQKCADENGGKIPTQGMTKDGKLWSGNMTVDDVRKFANKSLKMGTTMNALAGAVTSAAIAGLTLLAKSHLK